MLTKLDPRRVNDILRAAGILAAALVEILPMIPEGRFKQLLALVLVYIAGTGQRGFGHEYQSVADAKAEAKVAREVIASITPPPISGEQIVTAIKNSMPPAAVAGLEKGEITGM